MLVEVRRSGPASRAITGLSLDSRTVKPGDAFIALSGQHVDGHRFVYEAARRGASVVVATATQPSLDVPQVVVTATRPATALIAAWLDGFPGYDLRVVGVTGTDGKSTTCWLVHGLLVASGHSAGAITTVDTLIGGRSRGNPSRMTTPDAPVLQGLLAEMVRSGCEYAVLEVSSHGLAQHRVDDVAFDIGVLTNIGHDHLDYHGTLREYRAAKRRLFEALATGPSNPAKGIPKVAVINGSERYRAEFMATARQAGAEVLTYGLRPGVDVQGSRVQLSPTGYRFRVVTPRWDAEVRLPLAGRFNIMNALAAIGVAEALQLPKEAIVGALETTRPVPGRMQRVDLGQPFEVIVDYAHTPEALARVLTEVGRAARRRGGGVISVFGSAGERDIEKRSKMGRMAARLCSLVVVTEEDPRSEDQSTIASHIAAGAIAGGAREGHELLVIPDRGAALRRALADAREGDVVLLAGKGHERTIERADGAMPWDEASNAEGALKELGYGR